MMNLVSYIWSHLTGIIGNIVVITVLISLIVFFLEKAAIARKSSGGSSGIAIITGASSGLGLQYAKLLNANPEKYGISEIWLIARRKDRLEKLASKLTLPTKIIPMDLSQEASLQQLTDLLEVTAADAPDFSVGLLINCAGFGTYGSSQELGHEEECRMIRINNESAIGLTDVVVPFMKAGGRIAQIASVAAFQPIPYFNAYAASKALLYSYTRALRIELLPKGISVTAIAPYWIHDTEFIEKAGTVHRKPLFSDTSKRAARISLNAVYRNQGLSTPGFMCTVERVFSKLIPDGVLGYIMTKFM